ncbi:MAG: hypothetical protein AB7T06_29555 [Kofleriaceae bacterium]
MFATLVVALTNVSTVRAQSYESCFPEKSAKQGTYQWAATEAPQACLKLASGAWCIDLRGDEPVGVGAAPTRVFDRSTSGRHRLKAVGNSAIEICAATGTPDCHTVDFVDPTEGEYFASNVNYDGTQVVVARLAAGSNRVFVETYEIYENQRLSRRTVRMSKAIADKLGAWFAVHWVGDFVYLGSDHVMLRLDLVRAPRRTVEAKATTFALRGDWAQVGRHLVVMVSRDRRSLQLIDGKYPNDNFLPLPEVTREEANVWLRGEGNSVYLLYEAFVREKADPSFDGTVLRVDLLKRKVIESRSLICKP